MARIDCHRPYSAEKRCMHNRNKTLKFIAKEFKKRAIDSFLIQHKKNQLYIQCCWHRVKDNLDMKSSQKMVKLKPYHDQLNSRVTLCS